MIRLSDFAYELPEGAIAQEPVTPRDSSRLMVIDRKTGVTAHHRFADIGQFLRPGDVLVTNATKVFPARLRGKKKTGGKIEVLLIAPEGTGWRALVRGSTRETELVFPEGLEARMADRSSEGEWTLQFSGNHLRDYLDRHGEMPLPPYIKRAASVASDLDRYQTVYAQTEGAVAAPTAGFHFTPELLARLKAKGIQIESITLHVGWGTFRPIRTDDVEKHTMLPETYDVNATTAAALNKARAEGRRIVAVGTTAVRTLETVCDPEGKFQAGRGSTNLFIYPGYPFKAVDALITNFHLPDSTPLLLACAFFGQRGESPFSLRPAYEEAIREGYRFYSYGDAMFIQ